MKATEATLLTFIQKSPQFAIPIYQRNYSWTATQCKQLWSDLMRAGRSEDIKAHFIGAVVYVKRGQDNVVAQEPLMVIDGQQRLTTSTLLIAALAKHMESKGVDELLGAFSNKKLRNYYLLNPYEEGERRYKLVLSESDKDTLLAILNDEPMPSQVSSGILGNYTLFQTLIGESSEELEIVCKGLSKLVIVDVSLDRSQDNPQLIFESMNSTGLELSQADLIRNYVLMGLPKDQQEDLYKNYWRPMEWAFGQTAYVTHFDSFMRHYLTAKTGDIPNVREVYSAFKRFATSSTGTTKELVADIHAYALYYCAMALGAEQTTTLKQAFHDVRELKVDVAYPFMLDAYHDYKQGLLSNDELLSVIRLIESYVFRRAICSIPTNSLNKTFAGLSRILNKSAYLESVEATFLQMPSYRRFPSDEEFLREIERRDLYNFRSRTYFFRRFENHGRKERISVEDYTIEHVMPQNKALSQEWQAELGDDWQNIQKMWLHSLGNLTLTGYNSEYSDRPFAFKRDQVTNKQGKKIGFKFSALNLNDSLASTEKWDEAAIKARAQQLSKQAAKIWMAPNLAPDVLEAHTVASPAQQYSISDHPHLTDGLLRDLFESLRKAILDLDQCVTEEFLKRYVAYKAESNFVDIVPQAKRLLLVLNINLSDIEDPKNLCRDISNVGKWGNGNVEVGLSSFSELTYIVGLVRQSFDHQMGGSQDI